MAINNVTSIDVKTLPPFKRLIMTIGELPTSYLESMSYAELLMWFCNFLQEKVLPTINNNADALQEVINFLKTLDLQDEVNNKLDEMAEDGTLLSILSNYANLIKTYDTTTDLLEDTNLIAGMHVKTFGYYNINDGGGSDFYIVENQPSKSPYITLGELYGEIILTDNFIYPEQLGAKKNVESFDNSPYIELASSFDIPVKFNAGIYFCKSSIDLTNRRVCLFSDYSIENHLILPTQENEGVVTPKTWDETLTLYPVTYPVIAITEAGINLFNISSNLQFTCFNLALCGNDWTSYTENFASDNTNANIILNFSAGAKCFNFTSTPTMNLHHLFITRFGGDCINTPKNASIFDNIYMLYVGNGYKITSQDQKITNGVISCCNYGIYDTVNSQHKLHTSNLFIERVYNSACYFANSIYFVTSDLWIDECNEYGIVCDLQIYGDLDTRINRVSLKYKNQNVTENALIKTRGLWSCNMKLDAESPFTFRGYETQYTIKNLLHISNNADTYLRYSKITTNLDLTSITIANVNRSAYGLSVENAVGSKRILSPISDNQYSATIRIHDVAPSQSYAPANVGCLYYDSTNNKLYICTAITDRTHATWVNIV